MNFAPHNAAEYASRLEDEAEKLETSGHDSSSKALRDLADAFRDNNDPADGLNVIREHSDPAQEARLLREELMHSVVQRRPGRGNVASGVPWQAVQHQRGFRKMRERIAGAMQRANINPLPESVVAEGMIDILGGEAPELTPEEAETSAVKYFEAVADAHGLAPVKAALCQEVRSLFVFYRYQCHGESMKFGGQSAMVN